MNWNSLFDDRSIAALLSEEYARFARPVCEALGVFLSGLPAAAQSEIIERQAALPSDAGASERLRALAKQCPVLQKLGQTLARDRRLDPALRNELCKLETLPPSLPLGTLRGTLEQELGSLAQLAIRLDTAAIAEASVAVVIGYQDQKRSGVFKLLKPGVEERLALELELLAQVGLYLDERCAELAIPKLGYEEVFRQIERKLQDEVRLHVEQRNLVLAAEQYAHTKSVQVPDLYEYCTHRVTAMERVRGTKVTEHGPGTVRQRDHLGSLLARSLLTHPVFSTDDNALFHGDPHAGNLLLTNDGRLAMLDWSLAGTLTQREREAVVHTVFGAVTLDERRVVEMLEIFAERAPPHRERLLAVVRKRLREVRCGTFPNLGWVVGLLDDAVEQAGLRARGDLLLFRKSVHTLNGVLADVEPSARSVDHAFFSDFIHHLTTEWPRRWLTTPTSRAFSTRLSNADLSELMLSSPLTVARYWVGETSTPRSKARRYGT